MAWPLTRSHLPAPTSNPPTHQPSNPPRALPPLASQEAISAKARPPALEPSAGNAIPALHGPPGAKLAAALAEALGGEGGLGWGWGIGMGG